MQHMNTSTYPLKPSRTGIIVGYLAFAALLVRTLLSEDVQFVLSKYLGLEIIFLILFSLFVWKSRPPTWLMNLYLVVQSSIIVILFSIAPDFDFVGLLFVVLAIQTSFYFSGRMRWAWISALVVMTCGAEAVQLGMIQALSDCLTNIAAIIVIPAYIILSQEIEASRGESQALITELQDSHQQLELYAEQVEELAMLQERNRLARELHDSVSQMIFSINMNTRSAQLMLKKDPARVPEQLRLLQGLTADALGQLRSLITQLRPQQPS